MNKDVDRRREMKRKNGKTKKQIGRKSEAERKKKRYNEWKRDSKGESDIKN
jgi:hypothetical protein